MDTLKNILTSKQESFYEVIRGLSDENNVMRLDFSRKNQDLFTINIDDTALFTEYVFSVLKQNNRSIGIGGYNEDRIIYLRSKHFGSDENARNIHLGIDIWTEENTPVFAPLDAKVHSTGYNDNFGDYGATIILEHQLDALTFYTLYGHLSMRSIQEIKTGQTIKGGEPFAELGAANENGNWPPHLHFQLIKDMLGKKGDFPGVSNKKERETFLKLCPNPNLILNCKLLD